LATQLDDVSPSRAAVVNSELVGIEFLELFFLFLYLSIYLLHLNPLKHSVPKPLILYNMSSALRLLARPGARAVAFNASRTYHSTVPVRQAYKDSQDRNSLKPSSNENTKFGRDEDAAANPDAAFNPNKTSPEEAERTASNNSTTGANPLDASGANQELSKPTGDEKTMKKTGAGKETRKGGKSGSGHAPKGKKTSDL
jgi:hypothetical protein